MKVRALGAVGGLGRAMALMVSSAGVTRVGGVAFSILIRRVLSPNLIGAWNLIEIVRTYLTSVTLGLHFSTERLVPMRLASGRGLADIRDSAFSWALAEGLVLGLGTLAFALFGTEYYSSDVRVGLLVLPVVLLAQKLVTFHQMLLRATRSFARYSLLNLSCSFLDWSLLLWAYWGGLSGLFVGGAVVAVAKLALFRRHAPEGVAFEASVRLRAGDLRLHWPYGPKYAAFKLVWTITERFDSLFVGYVLGPSALAFYYLGFQVNRILMDVPIALVQIAFPDMMHTFAERPKQLGALFHRYVRLSLFVVIPGVLAAGTFSVGPAIGYLLPEYTPGIEAVKLLVASIPFLAVRHLYYQPLMAHEQVGRLAATTVVSLGAFFAIYLLLVNPVDDVLKRIALASLLTNGLHLALVASLASSLVAAGPVDRVRASVMPVAWCSWWSALALVVDRVMPGLLPGGLSSNLVGVGGRMAGFGLVAAPLCYFGLGPTRVHAMNLIRRLFQRDR